LKLNSWFDTFFVGCISLLSALTPAGPISHAPTMPCFHLLNKEGPEFPQPGHVAPGVMESGWWRISIKRAESAIGHPIHFHRRKAEAAFLSGVITGYRRENYTTAKGSGVLPKN
jgi:hypothetical protein